MWSKIDTITKGQSASIYKGLLEHLEYTTPHEFVGAAYQRYRDRHPNNPSTNGRIFEYIICEALAQQGITPFYFQAVFALVPNAEFDLVLFDEVRPVVLTMKTSLRERYKQADLEGMALRQVYRRAQSHLITLSSEAAGVQRKIDEGIVAGLDSCCIANRPEFSALLDRLSDRVFSTVRPVQPMQGRVYPVSSI